jgi:RNA polymerase sigma factor (sigma-70 family)
LAQPGSPYQEDLKLAERIRAGDEAAKDEFADRFSSLFRQWACRSGLAPEDAEDVAQQALLYAYDRLLRGLFRGQSTLETWSYPIIHGQIIEHWRKRRRKERGEIQLVETVENSIAEVATLEIASHPTWESFEEWLDVVKALRALPEQELAILLLNRTERRSVRELSKLLQLREAEVRKILHAAQERLRRHLCGYELPFRRHPAKPRPVLLPATQKPLTPGDTDGRSIQARSSNGFWRWAAVCRDWLRRAQSQCFIDSLLFWPCRAG